MSTWMMLALAVVFAIVIILSVLIGGGPRSGSTTLRIDK